MSKLTHINRSGAASMVDVSDKDVTSREAVARGYVMMKKETLSLIARGKVPKGDVFAVARVAGMLAAKKTSALIPLCHPLPLSSIEIGIVPETARKRIRIEARVKVNARTGVEMEAMTAVAVTALTIYDMCKAVEKEMTISEITLVEKKGGKSGYYRRVR